VLKTKEVGVVVRPGDVFLVESGGGGGYGDPRKREAAARERDVANGVVTRRPRARARKGR
jgi:N-methylhydantoinase B